MDKNVVFLKFSESVKNSTKEFEIVIFVKFSESVKMSINFILYYVTLK